MRRRPGRCSVWTEVLKAQDIELKDSPLHLQSLKPMTGLCWYCKKCLYNDLRHANPSKYLPNDSVSAVSSPKIKSGNVFDVKL